MRVSLTVEARPGICSKCGAGGQGAGPVPVLPFSLLVDDQVGEADTLCAPCLFEEGGTRVDITMTASSPGPAGQKRHLRKARKTSQRLEQNLALELNEVYGEGAVRTQPGSGNQRGAKGDLRMKGKLRVEEKHTDAASFSLKLEELRKIAGEGSVGEVPLFVIDFIEQGTRRLKDRFAVIHFQDLKELLHAASKHR